MPPSLLCSSSPSSHFFPTRHPHSREIPHQSSKIIVKTRHSFNGSLEMCGKTSWVCPQSNLSARATRSESNSESDSTQPSDKEWDADNGDGSPSTSFLSVLCPLLKLFGGGDPSRQRNDILEGATSSLSSFARFPWGSESLAGLSQSKPFPENPQMLLQLYEFEACPFCRRVREAITELDLSVEVYPCPKGSLRHRGMVRNRGGKEQFPFLIDPNSNVTMYESGDIVKYLFQQYGLGRKPTFGLLESTLLTGWMPTLLRAGRGMTLWQKVQKDPPPEKLILFSYENNPYARIVREALCELELPYILHNAGKGSSKLELLFSISGSNMVPYLVDPNSGTQMGDHKMILSYLFKTYSSGNSAA